MAVELKLERYHDLNVRLTEIWRFFDNWVNFSYDATGKCPKDIKLNEEAEFYYELTTSFTEDEVSRFPGILRRTVNTFRDYGHIGDSPFKITVRYFPPRAPETRFEVVLGAIGSKTEAKIDPLASGPYGMMSQDEVTHALARPFSESPVAPYNPFVMNILEDVAKVLRETRV